jgi:hypothetical protein
MASLCVSGFGLVESQRHVCIAQGCEFVPAWGQDNAGVVLSTVGMKPINGLRHPVSVGTTGWFVWCGETFSDIPDFFQPICIDQSVERLPLVEDLLGLPPGYRFLTADGYEDVWFDESLLDI